MPRPHRRRALRFATLVAAPGRPEFGGDAGADTTLSDTLMAFALPQQ